MLFHLVKYLKGHIFFSQKHINSNDRKGREHNAIYIATHFKSLDFSFIFSSSTPLFLLPQNGHYSRTGSMHSEQKGIIWGC